MRRFWPLAAAGAALALLLGPLLLGPSRPHTPLQWVGTAAMAAGAASFAGCRRWPGAVAAVGAALVAVPLVTGPEPPDSVLVLLVGFAALAGATFEGRSAWVAGAVAVGYLLMIYAATGDWTSPGTAVLTVPGYVAGTALRQRRRTAEALAERVRELDQERRGVAPGAVTRADVEGLIAVYEASGESLGGRLALNLPSLNVTVAEMLAALEAVAGKAVRDRVSFKRDERIGGIVSRLALRRHRAAGAAAGPEGRRLVCRHRAAVHRRVSWRPECKPGPRGPGVVIYEPMRARQGASLGGQKSTGQVTTIWSTSLAPKSKLRMRASSLASSPRP